MSHEPRGPFRGGPFRSVPGGKAPGSQTSAPPAAQQNVPVLPSIQADVGRISQALQQHPGQTLNDLLQLGIYCAQFERLRVKYTQAFAILHGELPGPEDEQPDVVPPAPGPKQPDPPAEPEDKRDAIDRLNESRAAAGLPPLGGATKTNEKGEGGEHGSGN